MNAILRTCATCITRAAPPALLLTLAAGTAACTEEKKVPAVEADAGAETGPMKPAIGGKLAAAVQAAESAQPAQAGKPGEDGPPEKGFFAPGGADKVLAPGAPPKVELLQRGSDPKVALAYAPADGDQKENASVAFRVQSRGVPIDYILTVKVDKPKDDKKADAGAAGPVRVLATISGLSLNPQIPRDAADQLAKIKGTEVRYQLSPKGVISDVAFNLAKGVDPSFDQLLHSLMEGVGILTPPLPAEPVGAGGYWMVTDRLTSGLVDVVRYRVYHVDKVEGGHASLSVDVRQYAAKAEVDAGGGQKLSMDQFESQGKGQLDWTAQGLLPAHGEAQVRLVLASNVGGQQGVFQSELSAKLAAADPDPKKK
jgi:hypothetical protein